MNGKGKHHSNPKHNQKMPMHKPHHGGGAHNKTHPKNSTHDRPIHTRPRPLPPSRGQPAVSPVLPVSSGSCSGVCQDNSLPCGVDYVAHMCPGAANIQCCTSPMTDDGGNGGNGDGSGGDDFSVMQQVLQQSNKRVSVGSYTGVPNGFFQTSNGALVYTGKMDTDCDGAPSCPSIDPYGQTSTSYSYGGKAIDALKTNYIVLPSDLSRKLGGVYKLGDIAAVSYNGRVSYAIYADNGPLGKAGEGSVHLTQELGFNPYCGSKICRGISSGVSYVVFPGSRSKYGSPYDSDSLSAAGSQLLSQQLN